MQFNLKEIFLIKLLLQIIQNNKNYQSSRKLHSGRHFHIHLLKLSKMLSTAFPFVAGILIIFKIGNFELNWNKNFHCEKISFTLNKRQSQVTSKIAPNTLNTYSTMSQKRTGKLTVKSKPENKLTSILKAMAVLREFCGNTSTVYKYGIGPRPIPKHTQEMRIQA